eukprot:COSAG01_NODE_2326_length_7903_cov_22.624552_8_plen_291_part_00
MRPFSSVYAALRDLPDRCARCMFKHCTKSDAVVNGPLWRHGELGGVEVTLVLSDSEGVCPATFYGGPSKFANGGSKFTGKVLLARDIFTLWPDTTQIDTHFLAYHFKGAGALPDTSHQRTPMMWPVVLTLGDLSDDVDLSNLLRRICRVRPMAVILVGQLDEYHLRCNASGFKSPVVVVDPKELAKFEPDFPELETCREYKPAESAWNLRPGPQGVWLDTNTQDKECRKLFTKQEAVSISLKPVPLLAPLDPTEQMSLPNNHEVYSTRPWQPTCPDTTVKTDVVTAVRKR